MRTKFNFRIRFPKFLYIILVCTHFNLKIVHLLDAPPITIPDQGTVVGTYLKMFRTQNIKAYLGIPFAQAPRFAPPEIGNLKWPGVRNATSYGPNCWQKSSKNLDMNTKIIFDLLSNQKSNLDENVYDENCLNLNIFLPDGFAGSTGFAVIVWIHAGDFSYGSSTTIDPFHLVFKQNVIVVTIAYRLNIFGFLSTGDGESPGNYGLMDQSAGLYWVRKNIHLFGGDPNKITIMGHSAGAISVGLHLTSREWSKDAFQKAVMMSGNHLAKDVVKNPIEYAKTLDMIANAFDCPNKPTYLLIQCLKRHDAKTIIDNMPPIEWGPVIDGGLSNSSLPFIETEPITSFKIGNYHKVPLLIGLTDMEDALLIIENDNTNKITSEYFYKVISDIALNDLKKLYEPEFESVCSHSQIVIDSIDYIYDVRNGGDVLNSFVNFYTDKMYAAPTCQLADILTESENIYTYFFNIKPKTKFYELPTWVNVPKFFDQIFIWGVPYMNNYELVKEWNYTDKKISDIVMTLWANFAKTSNPTISNVYVKWSPYNKLNRTFLNINDNFEYKTLNNIHRISFWNEYYPKILNFTAECCSLNSSTNFHLSFYIILLNVIIYFRKYLNYL